MFKIYDGREQFYQWDLNRKLIIEDSSINQVHFCNRTDNCSIVRNVYEIEGKRLVDVPNILLQDTWRINVYAFDKEFTKHCAKFEVAARTKPENYVYTETEVNTWTNLEERITYLEQNNNDAAVNELEERVTNLEENNNNDIVSNLEERVNVLEESTKDISLVKKGVGAPDETTGDVGEFYLDTEGEQLYFSTAVGVWGKITVTLPPKPAKLINGHTTNYWWSIYHKDTMTYYNEKTPTTEIPAGIYYVDSADTDVQYRVQLEDGSWQGEVDYLAFKQIDNDSIYVPEGATLIVDYPIDFNAGGSGDTSGVAYMRKDNTRGNYIDTVTPTITYWDIVEDVFNDYSATSEFMEIPSGTYYCNNNDTEICAYIIRADGFVTGEIGFTVGMSEFKLYTGDTLVLYSTVDAITPDNPSSSGTAKLRVDTSRGSYIESCLPTIRGNNDEEYTAVVGRDIEITGDTGYNFIDVDTDVQFYIIDEHGNAGAEYYAASEILFYISSGQTIVVFTDY